MRKQKSGTIIHISSVSGQFGYPFFSAYCASKHALEAFGESMRFELKPFGIHVVLIEPGMIQTDFVQKNLIVEQSAFAEDSPYRKAAQAIKEKYYKRDDAAPPPDLVAKKISRILKLKSPKLRYTVRWDSGLQALLKRILPQSWVERLVLKIYNLENLYAKEN